MAAALGLLFVALALGIGIGGTPPGEHRLLVELTATVGTGADDVMVGIGRATESHWIALIGAVFVAGFAVADRRRAALQLALAIGVVVVVNPVLKELIGRPRPSVRVSPVEVSSRSFPSGHASASLGLAGALVLVAWRTRWHRMAIVGGTVFVVVVAWSRLAIGVHYPTDILGGWLWVAAWLCVVADRTGGPDMGLPDETGSAG